jgi:hypothetical protein
MRFHGKVDRERVGFIGFPQFNRALLSTRLNGGASPGFDTFGFLAGVCVVS